MGIALSAALGTVGVSLSPTKQVVSILVDSIYKQYEVNNGLATFEGFHSAILDIYSSFSKAVIGKHYEAPELSSVKTWYEKWNKAEESKKREIFLSFFEDLEEKNRDHTTMILAGAITPPAAMYTKKALEKQPNLWALKHVPDIVFVPSATAIVLVSVKLSVRALLG